MVTLRTSSVDLEDHHGQRPRKIPRGAPDGGMGMPPISINGPRGRVGPPMGIGGLGPPLPPPSPVGPPSRTTATSRRGGRTRARSPIVVAGGGPSGRRPGSAEPASERRAGTGENPSLAAAAAAAAAAKAFSDNSSGAPGGLGRNAQWPDMHHDERSGYPNSPYSRSGGPSTKWPMNGGSDSKISSGSGHYSQHSYGPYTGGYDAYAGDGYPYNDRRYRGSDRAPPPHHQFKHSDIRGPPEGPHRGGIEAGRGPMYHHNHYHHHGEYHHRSYGGGGGIVDSRGPSSHPPPPTAPALGPLSSSKPSRSSTTSAAAASGAGGGGGTSLVIGGTTPIHVPKPEIHPEPPERHSRASAASVFRGRTNAENTVSEHPGADIPDEETPQKILLSLKTPSTSFEEKKSEETKRPALSGPPMSPKDPPQLHSTAQQRAVDMFERSPDGNKNVPAIDINPSFTLFNQSFDSLGENYLNVESTLHADSFGMMQTGSTVGEGEGMANVLRSAFSTGNGSAQLLAPSGSGHLTIGYSPVNSFGGASAPAPARREGTNGTMMILGGPDGRATSPTQVLSTYNQGYAGHRNHPSDDSHLRMTVGSFGGHSYGRPSLGEHGSSQHYYNGPMGGHQSEQRADGMPPFYIVLKKYKAAFAGCCFLLPGLKAVLHDTKPGDKNSNDGNTPSNEKKPAATSHSFGEPTAVDMVIARRRVETSICAFGGSHGNDSQMQKTPDTTSNTTSSIFRGREKSTTDETAATTVTPSSSTASPPRPGPSLKQKSRYEEELPGRYYENESRLSWEFEENPPIELAPEGGGIKGTKIGQDKKEVSKSTDEASIASKRLGATSPPASKMRYRCKLCGQPKQNHTCPYQQSLARSIGIMVYPAVNAFTAAEPGTIAPALAEMNNFTDLSEKGSVANDSSPGRSGIALTAPKQVTPESARVSPRQLHVGSPPTTPNPTPAHINSNMVRRVGQSKGRKRPFDGRMLDDQGDLLFVEAMELKPQQFLTVSESNDLSSPEAYRYLSLPLPYAQRKRLSDNLFSLSNEVPKLTDECAQVLREAREKDKWDLAVAELMTQVVVVLHCHDGDHRFEGLRQYLLTLGISC